MSASKATSAYTVLSSTHGRGRRKEREIHKIDLQSALKYGIKQKGKVVRGDQRWSFTYGGICYITDSTCRKEITSFPSRDKCSDSSGTKVSKPTLIPSRTLDDIYKFSCNREDSLLSRQQDRWTSHTVLVVDYSGSMRRDDINGACCRSDAVWTAVARDYIAYQLNSQNPNMTGGTYTDVISVILMSDEATTVMTFRALTWSLFNDILDFKSWDEHRPSQGGHYLPALEEAQRLLAVNKSCPVSLMFISDGKPSDRGNFAERVGDLASTFGRRLSFLAIGLGIPGEEDFSVLKEMAQAATHYGCRSHFTAPDLNQMSLSNILSSLATSLTCSRTEMTELGSGTKRFVKEVERERCDAADDRFITSEWKVYGPSTHRAKRGNVLRVREWDFHQDKLVNMSPKYISVAIKDKVFGEGAERMVRKFRFMKAGSFAFEPYVAKESRFIDDDDEMYTDKTNTYHDTFCRGQSTAGEMAKRFNEALLPYSGRGMNVLNENGRYSRDIPSISFLKCYVVQLLDFVYDTTYSVLIEAQLDNTKYIKHNSNNGYVKGNSLDTLIDQMKGLGVNHHQEGHLQAIQEYDSEDDSSEDEDEKSDDGVWMFRAIDLPQAFSHFSHVTSRGKLMVCDLQGVFDDVHNEFEFTDPVIHKCSRHKTKQNYFGRTNHGKEGFDAFYKSHKCNDWCKLLGLPKYIPR